jgi:hypothetical protein
MEENKEAVAQHISFEETKELLKELKVSNVADQFSNRIITLLIASLGLTTALAWDETLKELFHAIFGAGDSLASKLLYSVLITLIAVTITLILAKMLRDKEAKK